MSNMLTLSVAVAEKAISVGVAQARLAGATLSQLPGAPKSLQASAAYDKLVRNWEAVAMAALAPWKQLSAK